MNKGPTKNKGLSTEEREKIEGDRLAARQNAKIAKAIKRKEQNKGYGSFLDRKPYDRKAESRSSNSTTTMLNELDSTIQPGWYHVYI